MSITDVCALIIGNAVITCILIFLYDLNKEKRK